MENILNTYVDVYDLLDYTLKRKLIHGSELPYEEAKKVIQELKLFSMRAFVELARQGKLPKGIPSVPYRIYKNKGWTSWPDFLGNGNIVYSKRKLLPFKEARRIIRTLGIKSEKEYRKLGKQGKLPQGLPANPQLVYRKR